MFINILIIMGVCATFGSIHTFSIASKENNFTIQKSCEQNVLCELNQAEEWSKTEESVVKINGKANITLNGNYENDLKINSKLNLSKTTTVNCPGLENAENLTQTQLVNRLTAPCRFDRLERPSIMLEDGSLSAVDVYARTFIYVMQSVDSTSLQLQMHGLLQLRYQDHRLNFAKYAPNRRQPIIGELQLRELIWVPHIFLTNEHESSILGTNEKDILTSISPDGTVVLSTRLKATLYCWMDLQKFPFDEQLCSTVLESWMYNSSALRLHWEEDSPIAFDSKMHLTEYSLENAWCNESMVIADENDMRHGAFSGNYSSLNFTVYLVRESGYYIMDYFLPSIMIVTISWVSFWLQADQTPARTTLGTSTMLSFITLASSQENNLPKVSYIKISEIWFVACTLFIFSSLVEFAFVNSIWRRKRNVEVKKINSKHILKSTLTPRDSRYRNFSRGASSTNSLELTGQSINESEIDQSETHSTWASMTPQEVSLWIDRKARFVFPLAFLIFNTIFWTLVYCL